MASVSTYRFNQRSMRGGVATTIVKLRLSQVFHFNWPVDSETRKNLHKLNKEKIFVEVAKRKLNATLI